MTITLSPGSVQSANDRLIIKLASMLVGKQLRGVRYVIPEGAKWPLEDGIDQSAHEVDMGVELDVDEITLSIEWATPGNDEGLLIKTGESSAQSKGGLLKIIDVSKLPKWQEILGVSIKRIAVAFYSHDGVSSERPWSIRIELNERQSVVIALGEIELDRLCYMPDNLIVVFDDQKAKSYIFDGCVHSAWGEIVKV